LPDRHRAPFESSSNRHAQCCWPRLRENLPGVSEIQRGGLIAPVRSPHEPVPPFCPSEKGQYGLNCRPGPQTNLRRISDEPASLRIRVQVGSAAIGDPPHRELAERRVDPRCRRTRGGPSCRAASAVSGLQNMSGTAPAARPRAAIQREGTGTVVKCACRYWRADIWRTSLRLCRVDVPRHASAVSKTDPENTSLL
jgi:hypothetical protein